MNGVMSALYQTKTKPGNNNSAFSICDKVLLYTQRVVIPLSLQKKMYFETIPLRTSGNSENEVSGDKLRFLVNVGQRY